MVRGIIPARAGFTGVGDGGGQAREDHPRSRGVYTMPVNADNVLGGSSPLARGLRQDQVDRRRRGGIIPARAGFTYP